METKGPKAPNTLSIKLPHDIATVLHRLAYETGTSKRALVLDALRRCYIEDPQNM